MLSYIFQLILTRIFVGKQPYENRIKTEIEYRKMQANLKEIENAK